MSKISSDTEKLIGIIALMFGIFVITLLFINLFTLNQIIGIGILFIGIWLLILSIDTYKYSNNEGIVYLLLSLISIITGLSLYVHFTMYWLYENIQIYLAGLIILSSGILALLGPRRVEKVGGGIGIILGALFIILYYYIANLYVLAMITGIWLVIMGIIQFVVTWEETW